MDCDPKRLLESSELSPAERSVLQAARTPPASYDVLRGLERFRTGLAAPASPSVAGKLHTAFGTSGKAALGVLGLGALAGVYLGMARYGASLPLAAAVSVTPAAGSWAPTPSAADAELPPTAAGASAIEPLPERRPSSEQRHTMRMPRRVPPQGTAAVPVRPSTAEPAPRAAAQPRLERGHNLQHARAPRKPDVAREPVVGRTRAAERAPAAERPCEVARSAREPDVARDSKLEGARAACEAKLERARDAERESEVGGEPEVEHDDALNELRATARVRSLLRSDPRAALGLLDRLDQLHPHGYFLEERAALRVFALLAAGERDDASAQARAFVRDHPHSPFAAQVRKIGEH